MSATQAQPIKRIITHPNGAESDHQNGSYATTFPMSVGHRFRYDKATSEMHYTPLRLADLLDPTKNKDGVFYLSQSPWHSLIATQLAAMLRMYSKKRGWLILRNVQIDWEQAAIKPQVPDITAALGGRLPPETKETYVVGRDGGTPEFLIEITSKETRQVDLKAKPLLYAAAGVKEMLVIDMRTPRKRPWQLVGYQLSSLPPYTQAIHPDAEGGVTFVTVGLRFVPINRERVEVYATATGEKLLTLDETQAKAEAETARANELERRLREAEALLKRYNVTQGVPEKTADSLTG